MIWISPSGQAFVGDNLATQRKAFYTEIYTSFFETPIFLNQFPFLWVAQKIRDFTVYLDVTPVQAERSVLLLSE